MGVTYVVTNDGSRRERSAKSLGLMGSAVFNGGFSTFLAMVLLSGSNSYIFTTFFKVLASRAGLRGIAWHGMSWHDIAPKNNDASS